MTIDLDDLRNTLGCFLTGVTVVTTIDENGEKRGFTANSFTSVSLDPPLILVCLGKTANSYPAFAETKQFAVSILSEAQSPISSAFASRKIVDKFAGVELRQRSRSSPIIEGALAWLDCDVHQRIDAGDHVVILGRVVAHAHEERTPLGFFNGNYVDFSLGRRAMEAAQHGFSTISGIFEYQGRLLLLRQNGYWTLPTGRTLGEQTMEEGSLFELLRRNNIEAFVHFVFAIAHDEKDGTMRIYYRGELAAPPPSDNTNARLVSFDEMPWDKMRARPNYRGMLTRYMKERAEARFAIYVGSTTSGTVRPLEREH